MKNNTKTGCTQKNRQTGAAAVEFALIASIFFLLLLGIIEFGRLFFIWNSVQEVTRRAAREAVVRWIDEDNQDEAKRLALFGGNSLPAGAEITPDSITIEYLNVSGGTASPASPGDNISECFSNTTNCITQVRVSVNASYVPMIGLFTFLAIPIPTSTVTMPAESLGYHL